MTSSFNKLNGVRSTDTQHNCGLGYDTTR